MTNVDQYALNWKFEVRQSEFEIREQEMKTDPTKNFVEELKVAFPVEPVPEPLSYSVSADPPGSEDLWIYNSVHGRHWTDLSSEYLVPHWNSIWVLSDIAFCYDLPAYIIGALTGPSDSFLPDGHVKYTILNDLTEESFFEHQGNHLPHNGKGTRAQQYLMGTIYQTFEWYGTNPCKCT